MRKLRLLVVVVGLPGCAAGIPQAPAPTAKQAASDTPLGYMAGCNYRGAAATDVWVIQGRLVDSLLLSRQMGNLVLGLRDLRTAAPLAGGQVSITRPNGSVVAVRDTLATGSGWFSFQNLPAGANALTVRRIGYVMQDGPAWIRPGMTDTLMVALNTQGNLYGDIGC